MLCIECIFTAGQGSVNVPGVGGGKKTLCLGKLCDVGRREGFEIPGVNPQD